jgi:DNA invertase Pin-like site-specific DNA recombinase
MIAEFEADLARMRTREGMQIAKVKGKLRGKSPKLKTTAGGAPGLAVPGRPAHHDRAGRDVRRCPVHRVLGLAAGRRQQSPAADAPIERDDK